MKELATPGPCRSSPPRPSPLSVQDPCPCDGPDYSEITGLSQGNSEVQDRAAEREDHHGEPDDESLVGLVLGSFFGSFFWSLGHFTQGPGIGW